ncbi:MAG TPA: hypothetical protein VJ765_06855 [Chitinophagaceae bacterium]|nr:hypothetical protein [Chitinophagaceae bacterium]
MKRSNVLLILSIALFLISCSSSKKGTTGVWINKEKAEGKSFSKIFILVMTADIEARSVVESDLAAVAVSKGYTTVKSVEVMPPLLSNPQVPTKEELVSKVKGSGCDGVLIASLLKQDEDLRYVPGSTSYSIRPDYSWHWNYYGYYNHYYPSVSNPAYYSNDKTYFMMSNLYDVASEEIMWSVQSEIFNPSSLKRFSKTYTNTLIEQLETAGLLKK